MAEEEFNKYAEKIKALKSPPDQNDMLELYALYKQATIGDCNTPPPGVFDLKARAKHSAWKLKAGMSRQEAMKAYVTLAVKVVAVHG